MYGHYRYFYNRCVTFFNNYDKTTRLSKIYIDTKDRLSIIPKHLIDQAFIEAFNKFTACLDRYKENKKKFQFKYKKSKELYQTINLEKSIISATNSIFYNFKADNKYIFRNLKTSENFKKYNFVGLSITYHKILKKYVINLNYEYMTAKHNIPNEICFNYHGVRTFLTMYN